MMTVMVVTLTLLVGSGGNNLDNYKNSTVITKIRSVWH